MAKLTPRVLGAAIGGHIGEEVIVSGLIQKISSNNDVVELLTFDGAKVNVTLKKPLDGEATGTLEVWGIVRSKGTISASRYAHFPEDNFQEIDKQHYTYLITHHNKLDTKWILSSIRDTKG